MFYIGRNIANFIASEDRSNWEPDEANISDRFTLPLEFTALTLGSAVITIGAVGTTALLTPLCIKAGIQSMFEECDNHRERRKRETKARRYAYECMAKNKKEKTDNYTPIGFRA